MSIFKRVSSLESKQDILDNNILIDYNNLIKRYKNKDDLNHIIYENFDKVFNYKNFSFSKFKKLKIENSMFLFEISENGDNIIVNAILQYKILDKNNEQLKAVFEETSSHSKNKIKYISGAMSNKRGSGKNVMLYLEKISPKLDICLQAHGKNKEIINVLSNYYNDLGYSLVKDNNLSSRHIMIKKIK